MYLRIILGMHARIILGMYLRSKNEYLHTMNIYAAKLKIKLLHVSLLLIIYLKTWKRYVQSTLHLTLTTALTYFLPNSRIDTFCVVYNSIHVIYAKKKPLNVDRNATYIRAYIFYF